MADDPKTTSHILARQILSTLQPIASTTPAALAREGLAAETSELALDAVDADGLIALYFACEDPTERDIVFERLATLPPAETAAFFQAMMRHDEDEFLRVAAASLLLMRGDAEAAGMLLAQLQAGGDTSLFEQALAGLVQLSTLDLYPVLYAIWQDAGREPAERRAAMLGMEVCDGPRAADAMIGFVDSLHNFASFPDDQLEVAMAMLARHPSSGGLEAIARLAQRVAAIACADTDAEEERAELYAFVHEGMSLMQSALTPP